MQSFGWLCNTAEEFEPGGLEWLRTFVKLPVWAIGPLLPPIVLKNDYSSLSVAASGISTRRAGKKLEILSHKSTGAFLSHCGWNSVLESLSQAVPIIGWPLAAEQAYNSKMLVEEMGVSVELTRGVQGSIDSKEVNDVRNPGTGDVKIFAHRRGKHTETQYLTWFGKLPTSTGEVHFI
ncbi:hypothetical protein NC652_038088 [Populus alba x Populus x berolinensis]|nr:hypothetical protein NC652_038088 [Populus alba x Populus x berolinensis]